MENNKFKFTTIFIIGLLFGFIFGFISGTYTAIDYAVKSAEYLLKKQGYEFNFDIEKINNLLMRYNWKAGTNYALIRNNSGN